MVSSKALLGAILEAPGHDEAWDRLAPACAAHFGSEHAHLVVLDPSMGVERHHVTADEAGRDYARHYVMLDTAVHRLLRGPALHAGTQADFMTVEELRVCPVQQELLPRFGVASRLWVKAPLPNGRLFVTGVMRSTRQEPFAKLDRGGAEALHRRLHVAMRLHMELAAARHAAADLAAGFELMAHGVILLGQAGAVVFANQAARRLLDTQSGIRIERGRLAGCETATTARLEAAVSRALGQDGLPAPGAVAAGRASAQALIMQVMPLHAMGEWCRAIVFLHDPERQVVTGAGALAALGLTRAECRLVAGLSEGQSVEEYAQQAGLRPHTVRSMLKVVFSKTGTRRQGQLISLAFRTGGVF